MTPLQQIAVVMKKDLKDSSAVSFKNYPKCMNQLTAKMVCLNQKCNHYAFFCLECEDQSCEKIHRHEDKSDKYEAINFREFIRRVLKERSPSEQLQTSVDAYKETLERLRNDINQFVDKEMKSLDQIIEKAKEVPQDIYPTIKKLREQQYQGLTGKQMDFLWKNCGESKENLQFQNQTADFIRIKEEELKAISEHFQNLNKLEIDKIDANAGQKGEARPKLGSNNSNIRNK